MLNLHCSDIRALQVLTKKYHNLKDEFKSLRNGDYNNPRFMEVVTEITDMREDILNLLEEKLQIVPLSGGNFVLRSHGLADRFASFKPVNDGVSVVRFELEMTSSLDNAAVFDSRLAADEKLDAANYAVFRSYIHGIGAI